MESFAGRIYRQLTLLVFTNEYVEASELAVFEQRQGFIGSTCVEDLGLVGGLQATAGSCD
jgi:hypothetical protein